MTLADELIAGVLQEKETTRTPAPAEPQTPQSAFGVQSSQTVTPNGLADALVISTLSGSGNVLSMGTDILSGIGSAALNIPKLGSDVGRMLTGDQPVLNEFTGQADPNIYKTISDALENSVLDPYQNATLSDATLAQRHAISSTVDNPNAGFADVLKAVTENPRGAVSMALDSAGSVVLPGGVGAAAARGAQSGLPLLAKLGAARAATAGSTGANALMNAADTFSETENANLSDRYLGSALSGVASLAMGALTDGGAETILARYLANKAGNSAANGMATAGSGNLAGILKSVASTVGKVGRGAGKEFVQEYGEEGGNALGENVANREALDFAQANRRGALGGALGAMTGGALGPLDGRSRTAETATTPTADDVAAAANALFKDYFKRPVPQQKAVPQQAPNEGSANTLVDEINRIAHEVHGTDDVAAPVAGEQSQGANGGRSAWMQAVGADEEPLKFSRAKKAVPDGVEAAQDIEPLPTSDLSAVKKARRISLDKEERAAVEKLPQGERNAAVQQVLDVKEEYSSDKGWITPTLNKVTKTKDGYKLTWDIIPYGFDRTKDGRSIAKGTPEYKRLTKKLAQGLYAEVKKVYARLQDPSNEKSFKGAQEIMEQAGWYKNMRTRLRDEFGSAGDLLADLLGATSPNTPVRENWRNAVDILRKLTRGDWNDKIPLWESWDAKRQAALDKLADFVNNRIASGMTKAAIVELPEYKSLLQERMSTAELPDGLRPMKDNGTLYGFNTGNVVRAILDHWREVKSADAILAIGATKPKTITFSGNLIGYRDRATIDVWAARILQRMAGLKRIPSRAETGVTGNLLPSVETTAQFGVGQDAFHEAVQLIRNDPELRKNEKLREINDDDLQALAWFIEKEIWSENGWASTEGAGGSFEKEADFEGNPNKEEIAKNRTIAGSKNSSPEKKAAAEEYLEKAKMPVQRYQAGLSIQQSADTQGQSVVPTDSDQSSIGKSLHDAAYATDTDKKYVLSFQANSTLGVYGTDRERSFNVEMTVRRGYDPSQLVKEVIRTASAYNQDSTLVSRVLTKNEPVDMKRHRPGVEIYFKEAKDMEYIKPLLAKIESRGVSFYTVLTDARPTVLAKSGAMPKVVGVRFQFAPEYDERFGSTSDSGKMWSEMTDKEIEDAIKKKDAEYRHIAEDCGKIDGVTTPKRYWYDTTVIFKNEYKGALYDSVHAGRNTENGAGALSKETKGRTRQSGMDLVSGESETGNSAGRAPGASGQDGEGGSRAVSILHVGGEHQRVGDTIANGVRRAKAYADAVRSGVKFSSSSRTGRGSVAENRVGTREDNDTGYDNQRGSDGPQESSRERQRRRLVGQGLGGFAALRRDRGRTVSDGAQHGKRSDTVYRKERPVGMGETGQRGGRISELPPSDNARSISGDGEQRRLSLRIGQEPVAVWTPGSKVKSALTSYQGSKGRDTDTAAPVFEEYEPTKKAAETFRQCLLDAKKTLGHPGAGVEEKSIEELTRQDEYHSQCRIFLAPDGKSGFVIKNGDDLVSVFSAKGSNSGDAIVEAAIAAGARRLDCFNTILPSFYGRYGFRPVAKLKFNREYAPHDWDYGFFKEKGFSNGEPDIVFMEYDNDFAEEVTKELLDGLPYTDGEQYGEPYHSEGVKKYAANNRVVEEAVNEGSQEGAEGAHLEGDREASAPEDGMDEGTASESVKSVMDEIAADDAVGDSFAALVEDGVVNVVDDIDALPDSIKKRLEEETKDSRAAMVNKERRYQNGLNKLASALRDRTSVHRVVFNDELGAWIDIDWGKLGEIIDSMSFQTKGAMGLSHVIDKRSIEGMLSPNEVAATLKKMIRTAAEGAVRRGRNGRILLTYKGFKVGLGKRGGNSYVLTAAGSNKTEAVPSGQLSTANPEPATLLARNELSPGTRSRNVSALADIILQNDLLFKRSEGGDIQGVYDSSTGKSYLIASNIQNGNARGVFLHEVGVHMAADKVFAEKMRPLIRRAWQIVKNGSSNGDPLAKRVMARMTAAGLVEEGGIQEGFEDEALAYLVEEAVNNSDKTSRPIREWLQKVLSAIRKWLYDHGIVGSEALTDKDLVGIAKANVRALGRMAEESTERKAVERSVQSQMDSRKERGNSTYGFSRSGGKKRGKTKTNRVGSSPNKRDNLLIGHDEFGRLTFAPGEFIYKNMARASYMVFNAIDNWAGNRFNLNPLPVGYRKAYRAYKAEIDRAGRNVQKIAELMHEMPVAERRLVSDVVEKMVATGVHVPSQIAHVAAAISNLMDAQTDELLRLNLISEDAAERWRGEYLPRIYLKQTDLIEQAKKEFNKLFGHSASRKGIVGSHFKGRGIFHPAVGLMEAQQYLDAGWELRDPDWKEASGALKWVGEGDPGPNAPIIVWRDFTPDERKEMGEERDALARVVLGYMETQSDIALARFYASVAKNPSLCDKHLHEGWVKVPTTTIGEGAPVKRYGALAGKYVSPEVWGGLERYSTDSTSVSRLCKAMLAAWKEGKTALNPVAHTNNVIGNIAFLHFAGVNMWDVKAYADAIKSIYANDKTFQEAKDAGLLSGSWSREELINLLPYDDVRRALTGVKPGYEKIIGLFMTILTLGLRRPLRWAYENEDMIFKYTLYRFARNQGLSAADAVDYAGQYIFNYDDLPSGAQKVRDSVLPFFSWTYKAIPVLLRTAMYYPHRFFLPAMMFFAVNKASYLALVATVDGVGDDDDSFFETFERASRIEEAERAALPEQAQGYSIFLTPKYLRLWNNQDGTANFLDLARWMPGGDMMDINNQMGGIPWLQPLMPNSPQIGMFLAVFANKDSFTGSDLVGRTDMDEEAFRKRLGYVYRNIVPAVAPGSYHFNRIVNAAVAQTGGSLTVPGFFDFTGTDWQGRQQEMGKAIAHTLGVKVKPYDLQQEIDKKNRRASSEIQDLKGEMRFQSKALRRGAISEDAFARYREKLLENIQQRVDKLKEFNKIVEPIKEKR